MKKRLLFGVAALVLLLVGCNIRTTKKDETIQPVVKNIQAPSAGIPLYFGCHYMPGMSAVELRDISTTYENSIEQLAINELIIGPSNEELQQLIPSGTEASTHGVDETLFVTLSDAFLNTLPGEPNNWNNSDSSRAQVLERRKLAVYSIVNTVTEIGNYNRVQILIQNPNSPEGYRPTLYELGLSKENDNKLIDTLSRESSLIVSPQTLVPLVLSGVQEKMWEQVYGFTSQENSQNPTIITIYEFETIANSSGVVLESFSMVDAPVTITGGTAIVLVDYTTRDKSNYVSEHTNIPIKLVLVENIWKIEYDSILALLESSVS